MTPDLLTILDIAGGNVQAKLRDGKRLEREYRERYAEFHLGPKSFNRRPPVPTGLDRRIAALIRDEVEEAALVVRTNTLGIEATPRRAAQVRLVRKLVRERRPVREATQ